MLRLTAHLPKPAVGLFPDACQMVGQCRLLADVLLGRTDAADECMQQGIGEFPVDIELKLLCGGVPNSHRP